MGKFFKKICINIIWYHSTSSYFHSIFKTLLINNFKYILHCIKLQKYKMIYSKLYIFLLRLIVHHSGFSWILYLTTINSFGNTLHKNLNACMTSCYAKCMLKFKISSLTIGSYFLPKLICFLLSSLILLFQASILIYYSNNI